MSSAVLDLKKREGGKTKTETGVRTPKSRKTGNTSSTLGQASWPPTQK